MATDLPQERHETAPGCTAREESGRSRHSACVIERLLQIDRGIRLGDELETFAL
jgi:hypothetical protein